MATSSKKKRRPAQPQVRHVRAVVPPPQAAAAAAYPNARRSRPAPASHALPQLDFDVPEMVRGGSAGFTILLLGSAAEPIARHENATLGGLWLTLVGLVGFTAAGWRIGRSRRRGVQGAAAAVIAFLLTVPVVVYVQHRLNLWQTAVTVVFAVLVGGLTALARGRVRALRAA